MPGGSDEPTAERWDPSRMSDPRSCRPDNEGPPEGNDSIQILANTFLLHDMKVPVGHHSSQNEQHVGLYMSRVQKGVTSDTNYWWTWQSLESVKSGRQTCGLLGLTTRKHMNQCHIHEYWSAWSSIRRTGHK